MMQTCRLWLFVLLTASFLPGANAVAADKITIASKAFPESRLLAEIIAQLIEAQTSLQVVRKYGLSGTMVCFGAIETGEVDIYPEYTGTGLLSILKQPIEDGMTADGIYVRVQEEFLRQYEIEWLGRFGFNNTYVLAARPGLGLEKISDLNARQDSLRVRFQHEFLTREDGYPGLQQHYGIKFADVQGMEHGLAYVALSKGQIDLMDAYSTDGMLEKYEVDLLEDDRNTFPPYDAAPIARVATLNEHPELRELLTRLDGRISQKRMISMNSAIASKSIPVVAADFLIAEGLIDPSLAKTSSWSDKVPELFRLLKQHLFLTLIATLLATVVGVFLGLLVARHSKRLAGPVMGLVGVLQTIPSLAMLAFMIPLLGIGVVPAIAALFLYGLLPVVRNTYTGIASVPAALKDAGKGMGMTPSQLLWQLEVPLAMRTIMAGIRTALVISVGTATLGAFIGAGGFGDPINTGLQQNDTAQILWGAIPAALLALGCDFLMARLEKWIVPKGV